MEEGKESRSRLTRDTDFDLLLKHTCDGSLVGLAVRNRAYLVTCQVHELCDTVFDHVPDVGGRPWSCSLDTESICFSKEAFLKEMEGTAGGCEMLVVVRHVLQDVINHPSPLSADDKEIKIKCMNNSFEIHLIDTSMNGFTNRLVLDAGDMLQELLSPIRGLASNPVCSFHVTHSQRK